MCVADGEVCTLNTYDYVDGSDMCITAHVKAKDSEA